MAKAFDKLSTGAPNTCEPLSLQTFQDILGEHEAEEVLEQIQHSLRFLDSEDKRYLTTKVLMEVGMESPSSFLVLQWCCQDENMSWARLAHDACVHRSTVTREWVPKAVKLFVDHFLKALKEYLYYEGREGEWRKIGRHFEKCR